MFKTLRRKVAEATKDTIAAGVIALGVIIVREAKNVETMALGVALVGIGFGLFLIDRLVG